MAQSSSVSIWLEELREGDSLAAAALWDRYFGRLVALARRQLQGGPVRAFDDEDVVIDVFDSICRGVQQGRYPDLDNRDSLWRLLFRMTLNKAADRQRHEARQRRGGGKVRSEVDFPSSEQRQQSLDDLACDQPTPAMATMMVEEFSGLLQRLGDDELRKIATLKLQGFTDQEIAGQVGCVRRTIVRRLKLIRLKWSEELQ